MRQRETGGEREIERERVDCFSCVVFFKYCWVAVVVLCLFLSLPLVGLGCVIVAFPAFCTIIAEEDRSGCCFSLL